MLKSLVSGIKLYLDKRLKEQQDETDERIADAKWHETTATQLFSETVTVEDAEFEGFADLTYTDFISADTLTVIFDGVEYTCTKQTDENGGSFYGATYDGETRDYSEYPFQLASFQDGPANVLYTKTVGPHTVSASTETTNYTDEFKEGVLACVLKEVETPSLADIAVITCNSDISYSFPLLLINGSTGAISSETQAGTFNADRVLILYRVYSTPRDMFSNDFTTLTARSNNLTWETKSQVSCIDNVWSITGSATLSTTNANIRWYSLSLPHVGGSTPA